ncbi:GNAT family N-acetyltransferase [Rhodovulum sp. PH10]|uniref:GNAT family N-acetyltransferase n=1 Tax=Rhodovulum sp. PH10 TaxID=1187851 RepID=UPI0002F96C07|nr:GNAT family N-acetyltransferase [Rhodovulum sp. PH10]
MSSCVDASIWRPMAADDLAAVTAVAAAVHAAYPEDASVFAERMTLAPDGCRVLWRGSRIVGYVLSHPWTGLPPALNTRLEKLPEAPTTWYLHDLALLPEVRGTGAAGTVVRDLCAHAASKNFATMTLVAVGGSAPFWHRQLFVTAAVGDEKLRQKLASYDEDARLMVRRLA